MVDEKGRRVSLDGRRKSAREFIITQDVPATRSQVRSAWHALTGTRLVEPMPADIAESTLILADKYEDDGFGDQAEFVRKALSGMPMVFKTVITSEEAKKKGIR